ncbi:MAG: MnhB domain-containing protein [Candidatus Hadarchaeia archaeon]
MRKGMTLIVKTIARLLFPFMFLLGIYITLHGHLTPGGGFPGGVIIGASVLLLILAYGGERTSEKIPLIHAEISESIGSLILIGLGLFGAIFGLFFLENILPLGELGKIFSGGNLPVLNLGVGIKVAAGFITILYAMLEISESE